MSPQTKRFVFVYCFLSPQMSLQMSPLSFFPTIQTVQISSSFFQMYYLRRLPPKGHKKSRKKRLYRRSKAVLALSGSLYQVRLDNHRTFRVFHGSIGQTSM